MSIEKIEGLHSYMIGLYVNTDGKTQHYCSADIIVSGYLIKLQRIYYPSIDEAVQGLKDRLVQVVRDFNIKTKEQ